MLTLSSWERQVSDLTISVFSDNAKKMFVRRLLWGHRGGTNSNLRGIVFWSKI